MSWRRTIGDVRSVIIPVRGSRDASNIAAWIFAGTLIYYLDIKPAQELKRRQEEKAARDASDPYRYIERCKPIPDPQVTGLIYGNKTRVRRTSKLKE